MGTDHQKHKALETWDNIKGALIGVAATRFKDSSVKSFPVFTNSFNAPKRRPRRSSPPGRLSKCQTPQRPNLITKSVERILVEELQDLLHAEGQLVAALPKMAEAAHHPKLKEAFLKHLQQTEGQVERLKTAFELLGEKAAAKTVQSHDGAGRRGPGDDRGGRRKTRNRRRSRRSSPPPKKWNTTRFPDTARREAWPGKSANARSPLSLRIRSAKKKARTTS